MVRAASVISIDTDIDCIVIGAGVIGLAVARALALSGLEVIVLEAEDNIGTGISSRNSEVIHAGLYYPPGSRKARHCVRGRTLLYDYCEHHGIDHRQLGKLIVAQDEAELPALETIAVCAAANGVGDLVLLDRKQIAALEPNLKAQTALLSPSTGIVDAHALMLALQGEAEDHGAVIAFRASVIAGVVSTDSVTIETGGKAPARLRARIVVNAAGLAAAAVASQFEGLTAPPPEMKFAKGNYFGVEAQVPFKHLIYPIPEPGGLGVHLTLDMAGKARFGPDVEWVNKLDFKVDPTRGERFYSAIRRYWPELPGGSLYPGYCGIRPKFADPASADFMIDTQSGTLINLYGIESPGLTSCLAIAEEVSAIVDRQISRR